MDMILKLEKAGEIGMALCEARMKIRATLDRGEALTEEEVSVYNRLRNRYDEMHTK